MKLLIVDDSSIMRRTIEKHLKGLDLNIVGMASDGEEAVDLVGRLDPDIVTLDITMPNMDGLTCLGLIKKVKPELKVMVITALSDKLTGLEAIDKGARAYLFKPVSPEDLKEAFDDLLTEDI